MRRLQSTARLADHLNAAFHGESRAGTADQLIKRHAFEQGHDKVRFLFVGLANIEDLNNIGMRHLSQDGRFATEQIQHCFVLDIEHCF